MNATSSKQETFRIAVLDDYQNVALSLADWSVLDGRATVTVFNDHLADPDAVVERLQPFDILCVMRERTPMTRTIIDRLPKLRLIASTAPRNASIDLKAAEERGVQVVHTGYTSAPTNRTDLGTHPRQRPPSRRRECFATQRRLAAVHRGRHGRTNVGRTWSRQCRGRRRANRQGIRHECDCLESESDG